MVASTEPNHQHRFIVGVDFGTTFTSVAWAHHSSPDDVKLVQTWPNGSTGNGSADQVPTEVHYTNPRTREKTWGYEIPKFNKEIQPLRWFKLLLQDTPTSASDATSSRSPSQQGALSVDILRSFSSMVLSPTPSVIGDSSSSTPYTPPAATPAQKTALQLRRLRIQPVQVISDFLASVRKISVESIERAYETDWVRGAKISYVLTVPAIWSDSAKALMIRAAEDAGFGKHRANFNLVSEPEAASAYTLKVIQPNDLNRGDTFIICDAGGGTVDLISYKITALSPLRLDESVSGSGDLCGSVFLDVAFEKYIRGVLGDKVVDAMKPRSKHEMLRTWEEKVKFKFGNVTNLEGCEVNVPGVPDNAAKNIEDCFHTMAHEDVKKIFDPIVDRIVMLVKHQVRAVHRKGETVKAVLLVGGFGSSEYLLKRLQESRYGGKQLEILQPVNARSAIARGALLRGLDGSIVVERRARRYYGCCSNGNYRAGEGLEDYMYWCDKDERYFVRDKLNWYIKKDMIVGTEVSTALNFYRLVSISNPDFIFTSSLNVCDLDEAPEYKWRNPSAVRRVCTLRSDLSGVPVRKFGIKTNSSGTSFYRVDFELVMKIQDEVLLFELLFEGERHGCVTAEFK